MPLNDLINVYSMYRMQTFAPWPESLEIYEPNYFCGIIMILWPSQETQPIPRTALYNRTEMTHVDCAMTLWP